MMIVFGQQHLTDYGQSDEALVLLQSDARTEDAAFTSHRWLLESLPKRMIFWALFRDLLETASEPMRILDVGGGYHGLSRLLIDQHEYHTMDVMVHEDQAALERVNASIGKSFWINSDWLTFDLESAGHFDIIIANDLFPNVDQRLEMFLDKYLPTCREMRLSLTYYNTPRWYAVRRTDADELFHIMAWDGTQLKHVLEKYVSRINAPNLELLLDDPPSLFPNGRQVAGVVIRGGLRLR